MNFHVEIEPMCMRMQLPLLLFILDVLKVKLLSAQAKPPMKGTISSIGYDLYASQDCVILGGSRAILHTGVSIELPKGTYGRIAPRSGVASAYGIDIGAGVIDPDYRGEIKILVFNHGKFQVHVKAGVTRVAQLIIECARSPEIEIHQGFVKNTERGGKGFGSTGVLS